MHALAQAALEQVRSVRIPNPKREHRETLIKLVPFQHQIDLYWETAHAELRFVYDEGNDLVFRYHDRREILGLFSGRQWRWPTYQGTADPGWAANEAARIAREANPCAWLYFTHTSENTYRPITWDMRDTHGGRRDVVRAVGRTPP